jgi:DNA mismatch repair protein MutS2
VRTPTNTLDHRTLVALEWEPLLADLASRCTSRPGEARVLATVPATSPDETALLALRARDALALDALGEALPLRDFSDVSDGVDVARRGGTLAVGDLAAVRRLLAVARELRAFVEARRDRFQALAAAVTSDARLERLAERLELALDPDGTLSDHASPELREARAKVRDARAALKERLEQSLVEHADLLQGRYVTERDGRYALPVRADAHLRVEGIVLGSSASGGTLFVEPREATEHGNRLKLRLAAVEREEERVLAALSRDVAAHADSIDGALAAAVEADRLSAIAGYARATRAEVLLPDGSHSVDLKDARHPLLAMRGVPVVANDVRAQGGRALVISGPNAGGKTVVLKCLGLAVWMARAGLPIPAAPESKIGWFTEVLADVGDEQSLERSLSTFSAHVTRLAELVNAARPGTLVLLDEVASGTDPEEGAALAAAVLEALTERGAAVAVTTHYERLKELAAAGDRLENASVGFDFVRLAPTFRLALGVPGPSSALAVAGRFGLDEALIERARALLPDRAKERERAVEELGRERAALETERATVRGELAIARALRAELEAEKARGVALVDEELGREARELASVVRAARAEVREARLRLKSGTLDASALRDLERSVSRGAAHVAMGGSIEQHGARRAPPAPPPKPETFAVGATVRLKRLGTLATVEAQPERGLIRLRAGALRLTVPLGDVEAAAKGVRPPPVKRETRSSHTARLAEAVRTASNTLDLRGTRAEDVGARVDAFLDLMLGEGESVGFVLHGHGTGAVKAAAREHLGASGYVEHSRAAEPDEGGDAFTVFWIKD